MWFIWVNIFPMHFVKQHQKSWFCLMCKFALVFKNWKYETVRMLRSENRPFLVWSLVLTFRSSWFGFTPFKNLAFLHILSAVNATVVSGEAQSGVLSFNGSDTFQEQTWSWNYLFPGPPNPLKISRCRYFLMPVVWTWDHSLFCLILCCIILAGNCSVAAS